MNGSEIRVCGQFDHVGLREARTFELASRLGPVRAVLAADPPGRVAEFPFAERAYVVGALRWVRQVEEGPSGLAPRAVKPGGEEIVWPDELLNKVPPAPEPDAALPRPRVMVTGCFDWLHSGHIRFFEEASALGPLTVVVGSDRNVRTLKGSEHPMFSEEVRRYLVGGVRFVSQALISSGEGWLDAAPEIASVRPDIYFVNEDGDRPEKREFCRAEGIEYVVRRRLPASGLAARESSKLRGS